MTGSAPLTRDDYIAAVRRDGGIMASVADDALDRPVPPCSDWDVRALLAHTGWVHRWVAYVLGLPEGDKPKRDGIASGPGDEPVLPWFRAGLDDMVDKLESTPPERPVYTLVGVQPASWWVRRMAHETAIHRWDLQAALGEPEGFDRALAADGIDELFDVMAPRRFDYARFWSGVDAPAAGEGRTLHLHATDGEGEWLVTIGADSLSSRRGHEKADVAARGPLGDLYLFAWNRIGPDRLEVFGDTDVLDRFRDAARI